VRTLATILLAPLIAFGLVSLALGIASVPRRADSIVWSHQSFSRQGDLATWLEARGGSYAAWATRHPSLASVLETPDSQVAGQSATRARYLVRGALATFVALLLLVAVMSPRVRYRRTAWATRQLLAHQRLRPAFAAVGATAAFATQTRSAASPHLRSFISAGRQSLADMHDALYTPRGRRTALIVLLYTGYVIFAVALGAAVAIYFSHG
jgi:hypothetical protein